jgi:hypothetical protein
MYNGLQRIQNDLDYGKYQYDSLVALFNYKDMEMLKDNKDKVLKDIECVEKALNNMKALVENL